MKYALLVSLLLSYLSPSPRAELRDIDSATTQGSGDLWFGSQAVQRLDCS